LTEVALKKGIKYSISLINNSGLIEV